MRKFIVCPGNNPGVVKKALLMRGGWEEIPEEKKDHIENAHFIWRPTNFPVREYAIFDEHSADPNFIRVLNHFENHRGLVTKTGLIRSLKQYYSSNEQAQQARYHLFDSTPTTYLITAGYENQEYLGLVSRFRDLAGKKYKSEHVPEKHCQENIWLIKPANMNQGRGIEIFKNLRDIQSFLASQPANSYWVAQKYVERPLLYYGRKFDIRIWVVVTHKMEIFFFKRAYMRTSSDTYSTSNENNYVHLTNNCLQKHGDLYGKHEEGNTLSLEKLQEYLDETFPGTGISVYGHIVPRMKDMIIDSILSVKKQLNPKKRKNIFELFGYDFLIDEDFRTWLLEVNVNPYFGVPNDYIKELLPRMIDDMLSICLDPYYPPTDPNYKVKTMEENYFELIYCEKDSKYSPKPVNIRGPYNENIYPIASYAPPSKWSGDNRKENRMYNSTIITGAETEKYRGKSKRERGRDLTQEAIENESSSDENEQNEEMKEEKKLKSASKIESTTKQIMNILNNYSPIDNSQLITLTSRTLSLLMSWELHGDKEINKACQAVKTLAESKLCGVLTEVVNVKHMINLLQSQNVPLNIQITLISGIQQICRRFSEKKKLMCDALVHALIIISLASCDEKLIREHDKEIISLAIQCLCTLAVNNDRRNYIPGQTRETDKVRDFFVYQGGISALMIVKRCSLDPEFASLPDKICLKSMNADDWILQKSVLEQIRDEKYEKSKAENSGKKNPLFLFPATISYSPKKADFLYQVVNEFSPNFPPAIIERSDYPITQMLSDVEEKIEKIEEERKRREQEEEEKREKELIEQKREQEEKEKMLFQKRKMAEDIFLKRIEEKRKMQEELNRKLEEEMKAKLQVEEERKKHKIQELQRKKEENDKKNRLNEEKKKKMEEEMKKFMEEEEAKKKILRKQLEESFWLRLRSKSKKDPKKDNKKEGDNTKEEINDNDEGNYSDGEVKNRDDFSKTSELVLNGSPSEKRVQTTSYKLKEISNKKKRPNVGIIQSKLLVPGARKSSADEGKQTNKENSVNLPYLFNTTKHSDIDNTTQHDKFKVKIRKEKLQTLDEVVDDDFKFLEERRNEEFNADMSPRDTKKKLKSTRSDVALNDNKISGFGGPVTPNVLSYVQSSPYKTGSSKQRGTKNQNSSSKH